MDAPYEHNAGDPYAFCGHDAKAGKEPWEIVTLKFAVNLETPSEWTGNSPYCVQDINGGIIPWLQSGKCGVRREDGQPIRIWAGASITEFVALVTEAKGQVFWPVVAA